MSAISFPTSPPVDCIMTSASMARDGSWKTKQRTFGAQLFTIEGYGLGLALTDGTPAASKKLHETHPEETSELHSALCGVYVELAPADADYKAFNPMNIMAIIQAILALMNNFKQPAAG